jgi:hypothetical protein
VGRRAQSAPVRAGGAFLGWALVDDTAHDLPYVRGMTQRKRLQIGAAVALATIMPVLSFAPVTAGPLEDAVIAIYRGDDERAVRLLRPLAEQGDARAQYLLGTRYFRGMGVPQDYAEALKWFRLSADQENADGQGALGSMYYMGLGVPQDYVLAHMWFNLSAARGGSPARRDSILHQMTPEQIAEAQKLAREWKPTTQPPR